eukprot:4711192-Prymnesium_polylepis.2
MGREIFLLRRAGGDAREEIEGLFGERRATVRHEAGLGGRLALASHASSVKERRPRVRNSLVIAANCAALDSALLASLAAAASSVS